MDKFRIQQSLFIIVPVQTLFQPSSQQLNDRGEMLEDKLIGLTLFIISVSGSGLHGSCQQNESCGILDTYCKNGTCVCKDDFVINHDHCVQLVTPHLSCLHRTNCKLNSSQKGLFCQNNQCACRSFHHFHKNQCVKSKGLDEECTSNHQCYCGQDCNDKIECKRGICACRFGFKERSRRCVPDLSVVKTEIRPTAQSGAFKASLSRLCIIFLFIKIV